MAPAYVAASVLHFVVPELYVQIAPPVLPAALVLVYLSGLAEIAVGIGLLIPRTRQYAAWATVALLIAIFRQTSTWRSTGSSSKDCRAAATRPPSFARGDSRFKPC